jgi:hypothetical protein
MEVWRGRRAEAEGGKERRVEEREGERLFGCFKN